MPRKPPSDSSSSRGSGRRRNAHRPWRACGARSTGSTRNSSPCSTGARRSRSQIGQVKQQQGLEVWSAAREDEVIARALPPAEAPCPNETLRLIFRELMSGSAGRCSGPCGSPASGPKYSYSHLASVAKFGEAVEHVPVGSIAAVFEEVNRRHVQFGIVPLENSTDGRIADTLDMFVRLPGLKIRAEVRLRVHHCLLGRCEWGQVQRVYSEGPGALAVPPLARQEPAPGARHRRRLDGRGGRARRSARSSPPPSPAAPRPRPTASTSWPRTSRTSPTTSPGSPSSPSAPSSGPAATRRR